MLTGELTMDVTAPVRPEDQRAAAARPSPAPRVVLYGDFNCPWSYLASRRAALLAADGVDVDWRAVEHDAPHRRASAEPGEADRPRREAPADPVRLGPLLDEMQQVLALLLPGEELPYALAGFVPHTKAAVAAYAEAYRAGVAEPVRETLFEALWLHAFDLGDPRVVHTLIIDAVRSGAMSTGPLSAWDYGSGVTYQASVNTQRLLDGWATEWGEDGNKTVPTLAVDGELVHGVDAVAWLGTELVRRGLLLSSAGQLGRQRRVSD
jgi:hypothetical protein